MLRRKRERLDAAGWTVGAAREFLGLSEAEARFIELKLGLSGSLREHRRRLRLSQENLAKRLRCSQSHGAKMEAGDPSVSMDLLVPCNYDIASAMMAHVATHSTSGASGVGGTGALQDDSCRGRPACQVDLASG
jgi:DNA-binding XRE family transcriptional regulator